MKIISTLIFLSLLVFTAQKASAFFTDSNTQLVASFSTRHAYPEYVQNGQFLEQLDYWEYSAAVAHATDEIFGQKAVLGAETQTEQQQFLQQKLVFPTTSKRYLSFSYKLRTSESLMGFDEPSFIVLGNQQLLFSTITPTESWQRKTIVLPVAQQVELTFVLANTADDSYSPQLELTAISTAIDFQGIVEPVEVQKIGVRTFAEQDYLTFPVPITSFPILNYVLRNQQNEQIPIELTYRIGGVETPVATPQDVSELLKVPFVLSPDMHTLQALDAQNRIVAEGQFQKE